MSGVSRVRRRLTPRRAYRRIESARTVGTARRRRRRRHGPAATVEDLRRARAARAEREGGAPPTPRRRPSQDRWRSRLARAAGQAQLGLAEESAARKEDEEVGEGHAGWGARRGGGSGGAGAAGREAGGAGAARGRRAARAVVGVAAGAVEHWPLGGGARARGPGRLLPPTARPPPTATTFAVAKARATADEHAAARGADAEGDQPALVDLLGVARRSCWAAMAVLEEGVGCGSLPAASPPARSSR